MIAASTPETVAARPSRLHRRPQVTLDEALAGGLDEWIDVRSPGEFALDHVPGAVNCPVLDDEERARVGTLYKQVSPFEARRLGGALVAANIARHMRERFADKPRGWRPLVYCWRGGERSGAMTTWLRLVGWDARQLIGGYKSWRRKVAHDLQEWPGRFRWRVICGATGSGKTRLLGALRQAGEQVLDLEGLACHRGSVLGALPDVAQPSQKRFESLIYETLQGFDAQRTVYVEAESRKIGALFLPDALLAAMRAAPCAEIQATEQARLQLLLEEYGWFQEQRRALVEKLGHLKKVQSGERIARWQQWAQEGALAPLFAQLLQLHYDPLYRRSQGKNFAGMGSALALRADTLDADGLAAMVVQLQRAQGVSPAA